MVNIQDAYRIWLNSNSDKSFVEWLEDMNLTMFVKTAIMIIDFREVDLIKRKRE